MPFFLYHWTEFAIAKLAANGVSQDDFEFVMSTAYPHQFGVSKSSGRPIVFGTTEAGVSIVCVFEYADDEIGIIPITAYEQED